MPRNAVSLELPSLLWNAVELNGERFTADHQWSGLVALGTRFAAQGDYSSWTLAAGVGVRYWLNRFRLPFMREQGGPLLGIRLDGSYVRLRNRSEGITLGSVDTNLSLRAGYRFVFLRRVEVTPEVGLAVTTGLDEVPGVVGVPRTSGVLGLTAGYLF